MPQRSDTPGSASNRGGLPAPVWSGRWLIVLALGAGVVSGARGASSAAEATSLPAAGKAAGETIILGIGTYWREHVTRMPPLVSLASARAAGMDLDEQTRELTVRYKRYGREKIPTLPGQSPPPPEGWQCVDFDDGEWVRAPGPFTTERQEIGLLCRRGNFLVSDPARVSRLTLELRYRGGVIAYLNGQEVMRASLPDGAVTSRTPGADYPEDAFFVKTGQRKGETLHPYEDRQAVDQWALRERSIGPVELPLSLLRKGVNVLGIENHSSNYPAQCRQAGMGDSAMIGLTRLFLRARSEDGLSASGGQAGAILPNVARPAGAQLWNADVTEEVLELSYGDPCEARPPAGAGAAGAGSGDAVPLRPMRIAAVRSGWFSGQVVLGTTWQIDRLSARMGELRLAGGEAVIPAADVAVRYGLPGGQPMAQLGGSVYGGPSGTPLAVLSRRLENLVEELPGPVPVRPQTEKLNEKLRLSWGLPGKPVPAAVVPIWVSVHVPGQVPPGTYRGMLTVEATLSRAGQAAPPGRLGGADGGSPVGAGAMKPFDAVVPVEVEVFDWTLPNVPDYVSELSAYQSPDTLAAWYNVPLWSKRHWELIEQSVRLIAAAGNHTIIIPLLSKEQVGNEESYVYWVRQRDGSFQYDTSVMDRHLDVYLKHHPLRQIEAVCLIVWGNAGVASGNPYQKDKYDSDGVPKQTRGSFTVTMVDAETGAKSDMPLPPIGSREYEAFWRPVLEKVRADLEKRSLAGKMLLGMPADPHPAVPAVAAFHRILPSAGWFVGNHPGASRLRYDPTDQSKFVPVEHVERVYTGALPDPAEKRDFGWRRAQRALAFNRYGFSPLCLYPDPSVWAFRMLMEADLASGHRGAGRIGADYWQMPGIKYSSGGGGTFYARYADSAIGQTGMASNCAALLGAGPEGPVSTARFENLREGIQTAEAVVFLEKALLDGRITGPLADRCWRAIDERINAMRLYTLGLGRAGWQQRDRALFSAAAEAVKVLRQTAPASVTSRPAPWGAASPR